jgi:membrane-associated protease RseP (regulator of RpoE activity)
MEGVLGAVGVLVAIIMFVVAHEAGHYFAAKATGMKVTEFFIGFGPKIWSMQRGETEYGIKPIPFGAYVKIIGMSSLEEIDPADEGRTYRDKPFWAKSVVVLAGVAANFLLAFALFFGLVLWSGDQVPSTEVAAVVELTDGSASPAAGAGIQEGDDIVAIDGRPMPEWEGLVEAVQGMAGEEVVITVERDGSPIDLPVVIGERVSPATGDDEGFLGVSPVFDRHPVGILDGLGRASSEVGSQIVGTFQVFGQIFRFDNLAELAGGITGNEVSDEIRPVSIIGLAQIGAQADQLGLPRLLFLMAAVNVVLGTINVLPLFPLDGGHFAVAVFEKVSRRKVDIRALVPVAVLVIGAIGLLGVLSIVLDLVNPIQLPS